MASATAASASASAPKIPAPAAKPHQLSAKKVYELVNVSHTRRVQINKVVREVYDAHLGNIDVTFENIPKENMEEAMRDLREKLSDVFEKCEGDWFGTWVIHNRHRGRFRGGKMRNELEGTPASGGDEERGEEGK